MENALVILCGGDSSRMGSDKAPASIWQLLHG